jgi:hypothetical protein
MTPSPPAAAVPDNNVVGIDQNGPVNANVAHAIIVIAPIESQGLCDIKGIVHQPAAATKSGPAECQRRSPVRSE